MLHLNYNQGGNKNPPSTRQDLIRINQLILVVILPILFTTSCKQASKDSLISIPISPTDTIENHTKISNDTGTVIGKILTHGSEIDFPCIANGCILYLGEVITSEEGIPLVVSLDKAQAPKTKLEKTGRFIFTEVPPGQYSLILDLIVKSIVLYNHVNGKDIIVNVKGGDIIDLGELHLYGDNQE